MQQDGITLSDSQVAALERKKEKQESIGEIETHHPGYLGAQDTYYVGYIKGVGKIYQQTFIDTYTRVAFTKLYDRKNALVAADMLNDRVLPFFAEQQIDLLRILTDRGTEYCGNREHHEFQLYLTIEDIDHTKTKAKSPQTNGICERFHRTVQDEFYAIAFRKKIYRSIDQLETDLQTWMAFYNNDRTHSGRYCYGKTPIQTFQSSKNLAKEKNTLGLFGQSTNLGASGEEETDSAEEQPVRNSLTDWNGQGANTPPNPIDNSKNFMS